jgi:SP family facilitated glucose transporter-like MFS transporter 3
MDDSTLGFTSTNHFLGPSCSTKQFVSLCFYQAGQVASNGGGGTSHRRSQTDPNNAAVSKHRSTGFLRAGAGLESNKPPSGMMTKSYSINGLGDVSYLTPLQMGRKDLYELIPFTAVFGMTKRERTMEKVFASYLADLDLFEAEQTATAPMSEVQRSHRHSHSELMLLDEFKMERVMVTTPLIFAVFVASMSQFLVGYNTGVLNAPAEVVFPGHSMTMWSFAVAAFAVGGPFGAAVAGKMADSRGRRGALLIDIWTFLIGGLLQTMAIDMFSIILARFIIGFASGLSSVLVPIYLGELAPPSLRGTFGTLTQFALVGGILVADLLAFVFATEDLWRCLFAVTCFVAVVQLISAPFLLESPRWLLSRDPNSRRARTIIKKLRGLRYDHEVNVEAEHYISASQCQKCDETDEHGLPVNSNSNININGGVGQNNPPGSNDNHQTDGQGSAFLEMWRDKNVTLLLLSCIGLQMAQQLCGINAVFYYSTSFFQGVIDNPMVGTTIVGFVNFVATYVAMLLMDRVGRRTLILVSSGGMFFCCILIVLALKGFFSNMMAVVAVNLYVTFFELGLGPIPFLLGKFMLCHFGNQQCCCVRFCT